MEGNLKAWGFMVGNLQIWVIIEKNFKLGFIEDFVLLGTKCK